MEEFEMIYEKIAEIISDKMDIDVDDITMDSTFESLEIDSLDMVEIVMDIEEAFEVSVEDAENLKSVADLVKYIEDNKSKTYKMGRGRTQNVILRLSAIFWRNLIWVNLQCSLQGRERRKQEWAKACTITWKRPGIFLTVRKPCARGSRSCAFSENRRS